MRIRINDIFKGKVAAEAGEIRVCGWVRTLRDNKNFGFIELNDGSFFRSLQVVFDNELSNFDEICKLGTGAALSVFGELVETPGAKQPFELKAREVVIECAAPADYPLQKKRHSFEFLRTIPHLRPRTNTFSAVFRVRHLAAMGIHQFFHEKGFVYVHTPIITGLDAEGAGEMFQVSTLDLEDIPKNDGKIDFSKDFFGKSANLTVTGQLQGEAYALAFSEIYTFGPAFRSENSNTTRHLAEFWMIEPEMAFYDLDDNIANIEEMVRFVTKYVMENAPEEMEFFDKFIEPGLIARLENVVDSDFGRISYTDAIEEMRKSGESFEYQPKWGMDIQTEHERFIAEKLFKKPAFITDYPKDIKAFYMRMNDCGKTVAATDLVVPGIGEMVGGSQREERHDLLVAAMENFGIEPPDYWWYLDLRRFGGVKHSGYGLGFERFLMYITGMANIRDVIPFPRYPKNAEF